MNGTHKSLSVMNSGMLRTALNKQTMVEPYIVELLKVQANTPAQENKILTNTLFTFQNWKDYRVVLVGHSLGAGTAALVAVLLRQSKPSPRSQWHCEYAHTDVINIFFPSELEYPDMLIHCHAYATPCVLSLNLASRFKDLITT